MELFSVMLAISSIMTIGYFVASSLYDQMQ